MTMPDDPTIENYIDKAATRMIPEYMQEPLAAYVVYGRPTGGFLQAVISSDLFEAISRADDTNALLIMNYCAFFWNDAPNGCFGFPKIYDSWTKRGGLVGHIASATPSGAST